MLNDGRTHRGNTRAAYAGCFALLAFLVLAWFGLVALTVWLWQT